MPAFHRGGELVGAQLPPDTSRPPVPPHTAGPSQGGHLVGAQPVADLAPQVRHVGLAEVEVNTQAQAVSEPKVWISVSGEFDLGSPCEAHRHVPQLYLLPPTLRTVPQL